MFLINMDKQHRFAAQLPKHPKPSHKFSQQCQFTNLPDSLNSLPYHQELSNGEFHIADTFTVNHNAENVIQFSPKAQGQLSVLVQPYQTASSSSSTDILLGLYSKSAYLKTARNVYLFDDAL